MRCTAHEIDNEIAAIQELDVERLRDRWKNQFGRTAPKLSRTLLSRLFAYRLQAELLGDIDPPTLQVLDRLSRTRVAANAATGPVQLNSKLRPGTVLVREYDGILYRVMVLENGLSWNGQVFPNLSQVAFAITGTKWNGPMFFGLRKKRK